MRTTVTLDDDAYQAMAGLSQSPRLSPVFSFLDYLFMKMHMLYKIDHDKYIEARCRLV